MRFNDITPLCDLAIWYKFLYLVPQAHIALQSNISYRKVYRKFRKEFISLSSSFTWTHYRITNNIRCHLFGDILTSFARYIFTLFKCDITPFHSVAIWYKFLYLVPQAHIALRSNISHRKVYRKFRQEFISTISSYAWNHYTTPHKKWQPEIIPIAIS